MLYYTILLPPKTTIPRLGKKGFEEEEGEGDFFFLSLP